MRSRVWLIPLIDAARGAAGPPAPAGGFEGWLDGQLEARGYGLGLLADGLAGSDDPALADAPFAEYGLLNHTAHRLQLGLAARGGPRGPVVDHGGLFEALAHALGWPKGAERARALAAGPDDRGFVKASNGLAAALGGRLVAEALPADHPLYGHPFHQLLRWVEARRFARIARALADGPAEPAALHRIDGLAATTRHQAISAAIALAVADGVIDPPERAMIAALMKAARLDAAEVAMHRAEFDDPPTPEAVAARLADPTARRFVLQLLFLAAHVNGRYHARERAFIERLAAASGADAAALDAYEAAAVAAYARRPDLVEQLSLGKAVSRLRRDLAGRLERAVRLNSRRLWSEIQETGELMQLLAAAAHRPLTPEEEAAVKAQLVDVCKAIPALALFAVPGGSLLLPLIIRHLPIDLRPSNFTDEARPGAGEGGAAPGDT